jgi:hypothetical protein
MLRDPNDAHPDVSRASEAATVKRARFFIISGSLVKSRAEP